MQEMVKLTAVIGFVAWMAHTTPALACSKMSLVPHTTDPNEIGVDHTAPERPSITGVLVSRSYGPRNEGCEGESVSSCDGSGSIGFELAEGVDDRTSPDQLGYRIEHLSGQLPSGLQIPGAVRAHNGWIWLEYSDPGPDDQPEIDVTFRVVAIDLGGNESPASANARALDPGDEGCAMARFTGGSVPSMASLMGLALTALFLRRRARRVSSPRGEAGA